MHIGQLHPGGSVIFDVSFTVISFARPVFSMQINFIKSSDPSQDKDNSDSGLGFTKFFSSDYIFLSKSVYSLNNYYFRLLFIFHI